VTTTRTTFLTGVSNDLCREVDRPDFGILVTPGTAKYVTHLDSYEAWGADNGCFSESKIGKAFDPAVWMDFVSSLPTERCSFVALPDVLEWFTNPDKLDRQGNPERYCVGNLAATLERSALYVDFVRGLGLPVALVAQDGLTTLSQIPFEIDALFIGGSDGYKLGPEVRALVAEAKAAGLYVHVGRVNSFKRFNYCNEIGADSADGTYIRFCPTLHVAVVEGWLDRTNGPAAGAELAGAA
jgi:hypothetical protein